MYSDREAPGTGGEVPEACVGPGPSLCPQLLAELVLVRAHEVGNRGGLEHRHWPRGN